MPAPTLVILAAGLGRRFGGLKQLVPVGPDGGTIMDYTVFDAARAGFGTVVFVIRPELEAQVQAELVPRFASRVTVACAHQRLDDLPRGFPVPAGRRKPWGTGQAVLAAAAQLQEPFAVVNADDFYGAAAFRSLAAFLTGPELAPGVAAMVGYRLRDTLPATGAVTRALCTVDAAGWLQGIIETPALERDGGGVRHPGGQDRPVQVEGGTQVSMNLWGFHPGLLGSLRQAFNRFLQAHGAEPDTEFFLPRFVGEAIATGTLKVRVLPGGETWFGITNPEDAASARRTILDLIDAGAYPERLWR